ncbi:MAG TPA: hypothetical protein VGH94_12105 [Acidimicrobiales bacterium]|jgi:hypothetical protein
MLSEGVLTRTSKVSRAGLVLALVAVLIGSWLLLAAACMALLSLI